MGVVFLAGFLGWERRCPHPMIPPTLLRARSFVSAAAVYLISYTAFSGVLFYVTLLYQDVNGWSPLRTGLSWLFMNAPFLLTAQLTGRLDRRYPAAGVVAAGCVAGAAGVLALSMAGPATPFLVTVGGYLLCGAGFGLLVPGVTHVALRDVPPEISGAASSVVNASRQIGTSIGLAVLGALAVTSAIGNWRAAAQRFPAATRAEALRPAQERGRRPDQRGRGNPRRRAPVSPATPWFVPGPASPSKPPRPGAWARRSRRPRVARPRLLP